MCRGSKESWCGSRGVRYTSKGNEGVKVKGKTRKPLPLLIDGGVRELEDGACIYESWTFNLSKKEQEEPSQVMGAVQKINQW